MSFITKLLGIDKVQEKSYSYNALVERANGVSWNAEYSKFTTIAAYSLFDDIYSIVTLLAKTAASIPWYTYDKESVEIVDNDKFVDLIKTLNLAKRIELYTHLFLCDEAFIHCETVQYGVNRGVKKMTFLNPNNVSVVISNGFPAEIIRYRYKDLVEKIDTTFDLEDIIFIKGYNFTNDYTSSFRGLSPIKVLARTLTMMKGAQDVSVAQLNNGGLPGVIYEDSEPTEDSAIRNGDRKDNFGRFINNSRNKGAPYFSVGKLGYIAIGSKLTDLEVLELTKVGFKKLCNAWGVSDRLFNNDATGSEISIDDAREALYTNAVQPKVTMLCEAINLELAPKFEGYHEIRPDYSEVGALQEDLLKKAQSLAAAPVMIPNDVFEALGYDRFNDEELDKPFIKNGYTQYEDLMPVQPLDDEQ